jgi:hypothetical protein
MGVLACLLLFTAARTGIYNPLIQTDTDWNQKRLTNASLVAGNTITGKIWDKGGYVFNVMAYGAYKDGTHPTETRAAIGAAEQAAGAVGGTVFFPIGRYDAGGTFYFTNRYVTWRGETRGPYLLTSNPATTDQASTILFSDTVNESLFVASWGRTFEDLVFVYPGQIAGTATAPVAPVVYPYTLRIEVGNCAVRRCTFYNSYDAIRIRNGLYRIEDCIVFALHNDFYLDRAPDIGWITNINGGSGYLPTGTSDVQDWMLANATAWDIRRADGFRLHNIQIGSANIGIKFSNNSADADFSGSSYGSITSLDIDYCNAGISADSTRNDGGGVHITNFNFGPAGAAGTGSAILLSAPSTGAQPALLTVTNGAIRGTWSGGTIVSPQTVTGGMLYMDEVRDGASLTVNYPHGNALLLSSGNSTTAFDLSSQTATTLANNATFTPFGSTAFTGWFVVTETVAGDVAQFIAGGNNLTLTSQTGGVFTTTAGSAGKINVSTSAGIITIENKFGSSRAFRVVAMKGL